MFADVFQNNQQIPGAPASVPVIVKRPSLRLVQPDFSVALAGTPITSGILSAIGYGRNGRYFEAVPQKSILDASGAIDLAMPGTVGGTFNGSNQYVSRPTPENLLYPFGSAMVVFVPNPSGGYDRLYALNGETEPAFALQVFGGNNVQLVTGPPNGYINATIPGTLSGSHVFIGVTDALGNAYIYWDGALIGSGNPVSASNPRPCLEISLGRFFTGNSTQYGRHGAIPLAAFWANRVLTPTDVAALTKNPWQILAAWSRTVLSRGMALPTATYRFAGIPLGVLNQ